MNASPAHGPTIHGPIYEVHVQSLGAFDHLCSLARTSDVFQQDSALLPYLLEEYDRYQLWSGNLGAGHPKYKLSLDYRLEDASFYRDQILSLLKILRRHIGRILGVTGGNALPSELCWDSDDSTSTTDEDDDSSLRISSDSDSEFGTGDDDPKDSHRAPVAEKLMSLLESIKLTINCLYKLPVRKPAPVDRLRDRFSESVNCYRDFDIMYVRDKFSPHIDGRVAKRLGKMVTRRRQLLRYRESHARHLKASPASTHGPQKVQKNAGKALEGSASNLQVDGTRSVAGNSSRTGGSKSEATKLIPGANRIKSEDLLNTMLTTEAESVTSEAASDFTKENPVEVPPRPQNEKGVPLTRFECGYCRLTIYIQSERDWKKHVFQDLQPYVCTFAECELSEHLFESRDAWFKHEAQKHRIEFFCNTEGHGVYSSRAFFLEHLSREHGTKPETASTLPELFRRPSPKLMQKCNLCGRPTEKLKSHLSRHLQHIALFAVPRSHYLSETDAKEDDSNLAQQAKPDALSQQSLETTSSDSESETDEEAKSTIPPWLNQAIQEMHQRHENSAFEAAMTELRTVTGEPLGTELQIKCLDCERLVPTGPGHTIGNFETISPFTTRYRSTLTRGAASGSLIRSCFNHG
ncbi:uncharacterized protein J3D65DRAFT_174607 [Phyllosticta citribraziliensis]|uniref:Oxidoreductase acuF-like C2H2 type zinc-finger domain-containing protein n=1 Tax=Phyllosticta citribraziliensis TaxID=989973 RepID=A0ABR1L4V4_9PEZI